MIQIKTQPYQVSAFHGKFLKAVDVNVVIPLKHFPILSDLAV